MNTTYAKLRNRIKFLTEEIDNMVDELSYMLCSEETIGIEYAEREA